LIHIRTNRIRLQPQNIDIASPTPLYLAFTALIQDFELGRLSVTLSLMSARQISRYNECLQFALSFQEALLRLAK
jgi:hypothetical protein